MYAISDLERITGFTEHQIRDRLEGLSPILGDDLQRGSRGKILVADRGVALLRRMSELEREGLSPKVAQDQIVKELGNEQSNGETTLSEPWRTLIEELRERIEDLRRREEDLRAERNRLLGMLQDRDEQLRALLPGSLQGSTSEAFGNGGRARMTRWEHLKAAIFGVGG